MLIRALAVLGIRSKDGTCPIAPGTVVDVTDEVGEQLVCRGMASTAIDDIPATVPVKEEAKEQEPAASDVSPDNEDLESMSYDDLKQMARELGIFNGRMKSRQSIIDAIQGASDMPPDLSPTDVIV